MDLWRENSQWQIPEDSYSSCSFIAIPAGLSQPNRLPRGCFARGSKSSQGFGVDMCSQCSSLLFVVPFFVLKSKLQEKKNWKTIVVLPRKA